MLHISPLSWRIEARARCARAAWASGARFGMKAHIAAFAIIPVVALAGVRAEAQDTTGFGSFNRSLNNTAHGYAVVPDPTGRAPSPNVERFEVRPGDCGAEAHWSDCDSDRERSELSEKGARAAAGSEHWYGYSFFLPIDFPAIYPTKTTLGQFHQDGGHVVFLFNLTGDGYVLDDQRTGKTAKLYPLIADRDLRGRWHRVLVHAKWSRGGDGFFKVYIDGALKTELAGNTAPAGTTVYLKYGIYRAFVSRYTSKTGTSPPAQTALFARLRKGATRDEVE